MHQPVGRALHSLVFCAALTNACGGQEPSPAAAPTAPPRSAAPSGEPIAEYVIAAFADSKGVLWFGTIGKGVARYADDKLTYLSPAGGKGGDVVASIAEDKHGNLWFAGHDGTGLSKYDGSTFLQSWDAETRVTADRHGNIWAGTRDKVFRQTGDDLVEFEIPLPSEVATAYTISPGRVSMELEDSRGNLWFRSDGYGVLRHDGASFTRFTKADGLCSNTIWSIVEDRQGRIWLSCVQAHQPSQTGDGGLARYDGTTFTTVDTKDLAGTDIYTLEVDSAGALWIGATGRGVYRLHDDTFTLFDRTDQPDKNGRFGLQALTQDRRGTLWFGFSGGLFRLVDDRFIHVAQDGPWN